LEIVFRVRKELRLGGNRDRERALNQLDLTSKVYPAGDKNCQEERLLPTRRLIVTNRVSMSELAISRKSRDTSGWDYSAILLDNSLVVMMDHLPGIRENSLKTWHIFTVCRIPVLAFCDARDSNRSVSALYRRLESA
jgi:hypothetical protein